MSGDEPIETKPLGLWGDPDLCQVDAVPKISCSASKNLLWAYRIPIVVLAEQDRRRRCAAEE